MRPFIRIFRVKPEHIRPGDIIRVHCYRYSVNRIVVCTSGRLAYEVTNCLTGYEHHHWGYDILTGHYVTMPLCGKEPI